jgi:hypothetical protein
LSGAGIEVLEYYLSDYYRVVVIREGEGFLVSVDVYRKGWFFKDHEEKCVGDGKVCLMFKQLLPTSLSNELSGITEKIIVEGIRVSGIEETISVKWFLKRRPDYEDVLRIFNTSWGLIRCHPPVKDSFNIECEE